MNQAYVEQSTGADWSKPIWGASNPTTKQYASLTNSEATDGLMVMYEQQMTQFVMDKQEEQLNRLRKDYVFDDPDRVRSFLKSHRSLSEIFIEAVPELKRWL